MRLVRVLQNHTRGALTCEPKAVAGTHSEGRARRASIPSSASRSPQPATQGFLVYL